MKTILSLLLLSAGVNAQPLNGVAPVNNAAASSAPGASSPQAWSFERTFAADDVRYTLRLSTLELALTDDLVLEEVLSAKPASGAELPPLDPSSFEGLSVSASQEERSASGEEVVLRRRSTLAPARLGAAALAPRWVFSRAGEEERALAIPRLPIEVSAAAASVPRAIPAGADPLSAEAPAPWAWGIGAGVALLTALALGVAFRRARRDAATPPLPPWEQALRELERLNQELQRADLRGYTEGLNRVLRRYLEARFRLGVMTMTTPDLLEAARRHPELRSLRRHVTPLQDFVDVVRFGGGQPIFAQANAARRGVASLVEATTPHDPQDPESAAQAEASTPDLVAGGRQ